MVEIMYNPEECGRSFLNNRGKFCTVRKYHCTDKELVLGRVKWLKEVRDVDSILLEKVGSRFFNPYRSGIYYYQVQALFLLGVNEWHSLSDIVRKLEDYCSGIRLKGSSIRSGEGTVWDSFRGKGSRDNSITSRDYIGRIQENFKLLQRLSMKHPYGYKLHQVGAAVDIRRESCEGFEQGLYSYRLSVYNDIKEAYPIKDFSLFRFPLHEGRYVTSKFIGTIVTSDKVIKDGVEVRR